MIRYMSLAAAIILPLRAGNVWAGPVAPEFTPPINLGSGLNTAHLEGFPGISSDGLTLFFPSDRPGGEGSRSIWQATRESLTDPFGTPTNVVATNSPYREFSPRLSADGLTLFFGSTRPGVGGSDIWQTTRSSTDDPFGVATIVESVNTSGNEDSPCPSADGLTLFFKSNRSGGVGGYDIWYATRSAVTEAFGVPGNLGSAVNSPFEDGGPSISADGLTLYFDSARPGGDGSHSLWMTTRDSAGEPFGEPVSLGSIVNANASDVGPSISGDGRTLYFTSNRPGGYGGHDVWATTVVPEPSTLILLTAGLSALGLIVYRRRRRVRS